MSGSVSSPEAEIIDSHVHLDHIYESLPERISWMRERSYFPVSWAFGLGLERVTDLEKYLAGKAETIRELNQRLIPCRFLAGVHPRNIVKGLKPEHIRELILPFLENELCLGIGEIGLESGSSHETEVLHAQLELCRELEDLDKVLGIHTPRKNKKEITLRTLEILNDFKGFRDRIVVDHCMPGTIGSVVSEGFRAGITLSPPKASEEDAAEIIKRHGSEIDLIMLNTDSGTKFYEDLYCFAGSSAADRESRLKLVRLNAARFFRLSDA